MHILAASLDQAAGVFLHAGYISAADLDRGGLSGCEAVAHEAAFIAKPVADQAAMAISQGVERASAIAPVSVWLLAAGTAAAFGLIALGYVVRHRRRKHADSPG